jgi:thiol:disulfide interchange protein DsbC
MHRFALALLIAAFAVAARADEAQIRRALEASFAAKIQSIRPGPLGLYEVTFVTPRGVGVIYTNSDGTYVVQGEIIETKTKRSITEERLEQLNAVKFDTLPFDQAVKIQRGNGKRVLVMFSDPHCPYCKQFEQTLQKVSDITIYVFMYPVIRPELEDHSKSVWCSPDRAKAWLELALNGKVPEAKPTCANPVEKNLELGKRLRVSGTPTLIFPNGKRVGGMLQLADLNDELDKEAKR